MQTAGDKLGRILVAIQSSYGKGRFGGRNQEPGGGGGGAESSVNKPQAIGLIPEQGTGNACLAGFQKYYGSGTPAFSLFQLPEQERPVCFFYACPTVLL